MNGHDARFLVLFSEIGFALIVKFFIVRRLTALSLGKCLLADFVMNFVSVLVGIMLIPAALFLWQLSIGTVLENYLNIGTFNLGAAIAGFVFCVTVLYITVLIFAWLETTTLRIVFNQGDFGQESHWKFFWWLCIANTSVVGLAFGVLFAYLLVWIWVHHENYMTFDFVGRCFDAAAPMMLGIIGLLYYPHRVTKNIESGKWSGYEENKKLKRLWIAYSLLTFWGVWQILTLKLAR
jgi:hypothetical protein